MLPTVLPIFPLPNVVLFPDVFLPLHIFEPRYQDMVRAALDGDRFLGMVLLKPEINEQVATMLIEARERGMAKLFALSPHVDPAERERYNSAGIMVTDTGGFRSSSHTTKEDTMDKLNFEAMACIVVGMYGALLELTRPDSEAPQANSKLEIRNNVQNQNV